MYKPMGLKWFNRRTIETRVKWAYTRVGLYVAVYGIWLEIHFTSLGIVLGNHSFLNKFPGISLLIGIICFWNFPRNYFLYYYYIKDLKALFLSLQDRSWQIYIFANLLKGRYIFANLLKGENCS